MLKEYQSLKHKENENQKSTFVRICLDVARGM